MKKPLKIILIIFGILAGVSGLSAGVIAIFFPGLPIYFECKKECPSLDKNMANFAKYDMTFDCETKTYYHNKFSVDIPADWTEKVMPSKFTNSFNSNYPAANFTFSRYDKDKNSVGAASSNLFYDANEECESLGLNVVEINEFCESGRFGKFNCAYDAHYLACAINWDDFNIHSRSQAKVFKAYALQKESILEGVAGGIIYYENDYVKGFIYISEKGLKLLAGKYTANLFSKENPIENITIYGNTDKADVFWAIVNSVKVN